VGGEEGFDYLIESYNALKYARANEVRAMQYYRSVAENRPMPRCGGWRWNSPMRRPSTSRLWTSGSS